MKRGLIILGAGLLIAVFAVPGWAQTTTIERKGDKVIYRDKFGNKTGSAAKSGDTTVFRDKYDEITATSMKSGKKITIRDKDGNRVARVPRPKN